jgi:hypothetical protein
MKHVIDSGAFRSGKVRFYFEKGRDISTVFR